MMKKLALGLVALSATFYSCSSDDATGNEPVNPGTGQTAYMAINITDANKLGRTPSTDPIFEYGTEKENKALNAHFYFYNKDGVFVTEANIWTDDGTASTDTPAGNIEYKGKNVLVLQGLTAKNMPNYVVTVLNKPNGFTAGRTLEEMEKALNASVKEGENFIMTTTSYFDGDNDHDKYYFATQVKSTNFVKTPEETENTKPVQIYVERLAAKVTLSVSDEMGNYEDGYYTLKATVAGDDNGQLGDSDAGEEIRIAFTGWGLTTTPKNSYIFKNLLSGWKTTAPFGEDGEWNVSGNYRSRWAKSTVYDSNDAKAFNYITANEATTKVGLGYAAYCAENTNTAEVLGTNLSLATHIVLKAKIEGGSDYIRYNGILFKDSRFVEFVLDNLIKSNRLNAWYKESGEGGSTKYKQINTGNVTLISDGTVSGVYVTLTENAPAEWYTIKQSGLDKIAEGKENELSDEDFTLITTEGENTPTKKINAILQAFDTTNKAEGFKGGEMYYTIPIEHWVAIAPVITEGMYGVVRNHHYMVTVNKVEKLGTGIYNPGQGIVPPPTPGKNEYALGATINILSWRIMKQDVEL